MHRFPIYLLLSVLSCSSAFAEGQSKLSRESALVIAKKAAKAHGINLKQYKLGVLPRELSENNKGWTFFFECTPQPIPPGCHFFVSVNRSTGVADYSPGE
jgi:hypothetical protein